MRSLACLALAAIIAVPSGAGDVDPSASQAVAAPDPSRFPLGRWHLWIKFSQTEFKDDAVAVWGVDRAPYVGLEFYFATGTTYDVGGEIGSTWAGDVINSDGELIRDFGFYSFEANNKWVFDLTHGFTADFGFGVATFVVEGDEITYWDGEESSSPLASFGFGFQFFGDLTWRVRRFLIGVDVKYQTAADWLFLDHSNVRLGVHLGVPF